jgi:gluconokinase
MKDTKTRPLLVVVMGVTGAGKTLVGQQLAAALSVDYADGDAFHPRANIQKMAAGTPLSDDDRKPWLEAIAAWLSERNATGAVASCSALRRVYRDVLRQSAPSLVFLHLYGDAALISERVAARRDHFMPTSLVGSQFAALEPLAADERGVLFDARLDPAQIVEEFLRCV